MSRNLRKLCVQGIFALTLLAPLLGTTTFSSQAHAATKPNAIACNPYTTSFTYQATILDHQNPYITAGVVQFTYYYRVDNTCHYYPIKMHLQFLDGSELIYVSGPSVASAVGPPAKYVGEIRTNTYGCFELTSYDDYFNGGSFYLGDYSTYFVSSDLSDRSNCSYLDDEGIRVYP